MAAMGREAMAPQDTAVARRTVDMVATEATEDTAVMAPTPRRLTAPVDTAGVADITEAREAPTAPVVVLTEAEEAIAKAED